MRRFLTLGLLLLATACTTPQEACVQRADRDLAGLDAAIEVARRNIARGYGIEREVVTSPRFTFCTGTGLRRHRVGLGLSACTGNELRTIERPVPLDIEAEERKLSSMLARRNSARERRDQAVAACYAGSADIAS